MSKEVFTPENFDKLKLTCQQIVLLSNENINGDLMFAQLQLLGDKIKEFVDNPIVAKSGCLPDNRERFRK